MKVIGVDVKIVSLARSAWGAGVFAGKHNLTVQIFTLPDPSVLAINFASKNIGGQGFNWSRYSNAKLDADMNEGAVVFDLARRKALYQDAQKIIMENALLIPVYLWVEPFGRLSALKDITYLEGNAPRFYSAYVTK
jgi:peptide/nickel transport system substrate-binding protein